MRKELLFVFLILTLGCRTKLDNESVVTVKPGEKQYRIIDPISKNQTINVSATASEGKFNVYVFLEKDKTAADKAIDREKIEAMVLAHQLNATEAALEAAIPANEKAVVLITPSGGKKAEVKLKMTN